MSSVQSLFSDFSRFANPGLSGLRGLLQGVRGGRPPEASPASRPVVELSVQARQLSAFLQRIRGISAQTRDPEVANELVATGDVLAQKFARGAMVLQKTLEKFAKLAEKFAANPDSPFGRFLKIVQRLSNGAEDVFNGFMNMVEDIMQAAEGTPAPAPAQGGGEFSLSAFFSQVEFQLAQGEDGISISARITAVSVEITMEGGGNQAEPLTLDLNGNGGIDLTGVDRGAFFDINGDGQADRTSFVAGGDAVLALDVNGNGRIDSALELFGDAGGFSDGFGALSAHDLNGDGVIDAADPVFDDLLLLFGTDESGQILQDLGDVGVAALNLSARNTEQVLSTGDRISAVSDFFRADGSRGLLADVWFTYA